MGRWVIEQFENAASELIGQRAADYLMQIGVDFAYISVAAAILGALAVKVFWGALNLAGRAPEPDWSALNPDNEVAMWKAYDDLHTVVRLGNLLGEDAAATYEEFQSQVRRAGLWRQ